MELKSLVLGLIFSVGIFAFKSGAGLSYLLKKQMGYGKLLAIGSYCLGYGLLFWLAGLLVNRFDFPAHLETIMLLSKNGMTLHFLLAGLLLLWGFVLLARQKEGPSHGWLPLALPCPVCFSVILFSCALLQNLVGESRYLFSGLGLGFIAIGLITALLLALFGKKRPEQNLGLVMVLASLYFLVSMAVIPQFGDIDRIYRLSKASVSILSEPDLPLFLIGASLAFLAGFLHSLRKVRQWT
jgi:predicted transporter